MSVREKVSTELGRPEMLISPGGSRRHDSGVTGSPPGFPEVQSRVSRPGPQGRRGTGLVTVRRPTKDEESRR